MAAAVFLAPLAVGTVHRPVVVALFSLVGVALVALFFGQLRAGERIRVGASAILPAVFVLICALQLVPLPASIRNAIDPAGGELLANALEPIRGHPLSLDTPSTWRELGKAAAVLAVFLFAYHLGAGRRAPRRMIYTVAGAGIVALLLGLGHAAIGEKSIFGVFETGSKLLVVGPFVNRNHTAEFLELAAFACLALALLARNRWIVWGWLAGAMALAAGAISTLSRASVLALAAGGLAFAVLVRGGGGDGNPTQHRTMSLKKVLLVATLGAVVLAGALGAGALMDRLTTADLNREARPSLWADAVSVVRAHPAGIGKGAFEYVYPVYQNPQAIKAAASTRFAFVENGPLQLLIDTGWAGVVLILVAAGFLIRELVHSGLGRAEAALVAGAVAVLAHNLLDFGLEMSGIAVPFAAILGTAAGRVRPSESARTRGTIGLPLLAIAGLAAGIISLALPMSRDFDAAFSQPRGVKQRIELAREAQRVHPVDYFYVLAEAVAQPLRANDAHHSPRLTSLNRALRLCPNCSSVNEEVAETLWDLGLHGQALAQFREMIRRDSSPGHETLGSAIGELRRKRASPEEVALLDVGDPAIRIAIADELTARGVPKRALQLLSQIPTLYTTTTPYFAAKYQADVAGSDLDAAAVTLSIWQANEPTAARLYSARADLAQRQQRPEEATAILESGVKANPTDLHLAHERVADTFNRRRWTEAARAIEDLRRVLIESNRPTAETYVWGARLANAMGHRLEAISQYHAALAQDASNSYLWLELGQVAEAAGQMEVAVSAFGRASQLVPSDRSAKDALDRIARRREELRRDALLDPPP
jgi:O-Antigen ligase